MSKSIYSTFLPLLGILLLGVPSLRAQDTTTTPPSITLDLMASDTSWSDAEFVGHAFLVIALPVGQSIKEEGYGFYPDGATSAVIGGPGVTRSEFQKNSSRFSRVSVTIEKPITIEEYRGIMHLVNQWNDHHYDITDSNCIDFVYSVATYLKWKTPERIGTDLPVDALKKLSEANP